MFVSLCAAVVLQGALFSAEASVGQDANTVVLHDTYAEAHRDAVKLGKPLLVMVGTDWCGPCQMMKREILPKVREHGALRKVAFAFVNADKDQELAQEITGGGPVPQLALYRKSGEGWTRQILVGLQTVEEVEKFVQDAPSADGKSEKEPRSVEERKHAQSIETSKDVSANAVRTARRVVGDEGKSS